MELMVAAAVAALRHVGENGQVEMNNTCDYQPRIREARVFNVKVRSRSWLSSWWK